MSKFKVFFYAILMSVAPGFLHAQENPLLTFEEYLNLNPSDQHAYLKLVSKYYSIRENRERPSDFYTKLEAFGFTSMAEAADPNYPVPSPRPSSPPPAPSQPPSNARPLPEPKPRPAVTEKPAPTPRPIPVKLPVPKPKPADAGVPSPETNQTGQPDVRVPSTPSTPPVPGDLDDDLERKNQQFSAQRMRDAAAALDQMKFEGDCINAGFNFVREKGKKGSCRGISDFCQEKIGTSVQAIPPLEELRLQFCSPTKDSPNGRCGKAGLFGDQVICDPILFGVLKGENGKAKVLCVSRSRNSSSACAKAAVSKSTKIICTPEVKPEDCIPGESPNSNISRLFNIKSLVMARDCGWSQDPLTQKGIAVLRKDRTTEARKDIEATCAAIKPRLMEYRKLANVRNDARRVLDKIESGTQ